MIKSFEKLKVRIDQNLNRSEKSDPLHEDVVKIKNKVACLRQVSTLIIFLSFDNFLYFYGQKI